MSKKRAYCSHCKHDDHKGRKCGYGEGIGTTVAVCVCETDKRGRVVTPASVEFVNRETLFAKALDDAAKAAHAMGDALARAHEDARREGIERAVFGDRECTGGGIVKTSDRKTQRDHQIEIKLSASERLLFKAVTKRRGFRNISEMVRYVVRAYEEDTREGRPVCTGQLVHDAFNSCPVHDA